MQGYKIDIIRAFADIFLELGGPFGIVLDRLFKIAHPLLHGSIVDQIQRQGVRWLLRNVAGAGIEFADQRRHKPVELI